MASRFEPLFSRRQRRMRWAEPVGMTAQLAALHAALDELARLERDGRDSAQARSRCAALYAEMQTAGWREAYEHDGVWEEVLGARLSELARRDARERERALASLLWEIGDRAVCSFLLGGKMHALRQGELLEILPRLVGYAGPPADGDPQFAAYVHARERTAEVLREAVSRHVVTPGALQEFLLEATRRLIEDSGLPPERALGKRLELFDFDMEFHKLSQATSAQQRRQSVIGTAGIYAESFYRERLLGGAGELRDPWLLFEDCVRAGLGRAAAERLIADCGGDRQAIEHLARLPEASSYPRLAGNARSLAIGHRELVDAIGAYFTPPQADGLGRNLLTGVLCALDAGEGGT